MKKITSLALALVLALTLTACGKKDNTAGNGDSSVPADATALLTAVWDAHSDDEKFPAAGGDYENPVEDAPGAGADAVRKAETLQDRLVVSDGAVGIGGGELVAEGVHQLLVAVQGHHILIVGEDHQLVGEAAHPLLRLDGIPQVAGNGLHIVLVGDVEGAAGEGVGVHHVAEGGGTVDLTGVRADAVKFNFGVALCCFPVFRFSIPFYPAS